MELDADDRDAETRVAAVKALAAVAQKLFNPASSSADSALNPSVHRLQADSSAADSARHESSASSGLAADSAPADSGVIGNCGESAGGGVAADMAATDSGVVSSCGESAGGGGLAADPTAAALVREPVMGALLAAVEDYSTDNRWVDMQPIRIITGEKSP